MSVNAGGLLQVRPLRVRGLPDAGNPPGVRSVLLLRVEQNVNDSRLKSRLYGEAWQATRPTSGVFTTALGETAVSPIRARFRLAFKSACARRPQEHSKRCLSRVPNCRQAEQVWLVYAGFTYTTEIPTARALYSTKLCNCRNAQRCSLARMRRPARRRSRMCVRSSITIVAVPMRRASSRIALLVSWLTCLTRRRSLPETCRSL